MIVYIIVFVIAFTFQIYLIIRTLMFPMIAKAGNIKDFYGIFTILQRYPKHNEYEDNVKNTKCLSVRGNSMKKYEIQNGDTIFIEKYSDSDKFGITTYPVLVFQLKIKRLSDVFDSRYKLRKFVGYIDDLNAESMYNQYINRINCSKDDFIRCIDSKIHLIEKRKERKKYVLSETYDEKKDMTLYSLHSVESIYGKVKFAI